jgi:Fur family ferric uptake transcriptional regulator
MDLPNDIIKVHEQFSCYLKQKNMRQTPERFEILNFIYSQYSIVSIEEIYKAMHENFHVSMSTIYHTLDLLLKCNLVVRHTFNIQTTYYGKAVAQTGYYFLVCVQCGGYKKFSDKKLNKSLLLRNFSTFTIFHHSLYMYGICKKCNFKSNKKM